MSFPFFLVFISFFTLVSSKSHFSQLKVHFNDPAWHKPLSDEEFRDARRRISSMFDHAFNGYMAHAFPADELKPLSATGTNSLPELGNAPKILSYEGIALTLVDALDSLIVFNRTEDFVYGVFWIKSHLKNFDLDIRVHVFETNIRVLGGLLAAHALCIDEKIDPLQGEYDGFLLDLAADLGRRLLAAFETENDIPYAWVNLRHGVVEGETRETCVAGIGTLILEFGLLSYYTNDTIFYFLSHRAMLALWELRSPKNLLGNTLKESTWINKNAGIGAGSDSFYEYLIKAHILFGQDIHFDIFKESYDAVLKHLRLDGWYYEANFKSGKAVHFHFNSLQAFWSAMQVLVGDIKLADQTFENFFSLWWRFGGLPERVLLNSGQAHGSERHYPLRPELIESAYALYQATKNPKYLRMGLYMLDTIERRSKSKYGFAMIRNVVTGELEDYMPSFFLAETCKYLYLLFSPDHWLHSENYVFSTEGHLIPMYSGYRDFFNDVHKFYERKTEPEEQVCKNEGSMAWRKPTKVRELLDEMFREEIELSTATCAAPVPQQQQTRRSGPNLWILNDDRKVKVEVGSGSFILNIGDSEKLYIRQLGSNFAEILNIEKFNKGQSLRVGYAGKDGRVMEFAVRSETAPSDSETCPVEEKMTFSSSGAYFGRSATLLDGTDTYQGQLTDVKELIVAKPSKACEPSIIDIRNKIVLVERGDCTFVQKALLLQQAGAAGLLIGNTVGDDVFTMGTDGTGKKVEIPSFMVSGLTFHKLRSCVNSHEGFYRLSMHVSQIDKPENGFYIEGTEEDRIVTSISDAKFSIRKEDNFYKLFPH